MLPDDTKKEIYLRMTQGRVLYYCTVLYCTVPAVLPFLLQMKTQRCRAVRMSSQVIKNLIKNPLSLIDIKQR